jgi:hypothetical protein
MNFKLPEKLTRFVGQLFLKTKKISPELCVVGGIVAGGAAIVMVGVKTFKNKEMIVSDATAIRSVKYEVKDEIVTITGENEAHNELKTSLVKRESLTDEQKKQLWARRIDFGKDILKIYWVPGLLAVGSVGMIWGGRTMLRKELSAATMAYATLLETFTQYRKKVAEVIGDEKEQEIAAGYTMRDIVDEATGKVEKLPVVDPQANLSQYGFWFDEGHFDKETGEWAWRNMTHDRNKLVNRMKVVELEEKYTRQLRTVGYAWLEDVALEFGIDPDEAKKWHDIGWVWKEGDENRVEFGVLDTKWQLPVNKGFCDDSCSQNKCFINPNVDGYIGYIRDDFKKYDFRYGYGNKGYRSIRREFVNVIDRYNKEKMEQRVFNAMTPRGKRKIIGAE